MPVRYLFVRRSLYLKAVPTVVTVDAEEMSRLRSEVEEGLRALRAGPFGEHARVGKAKMAELRSTNGGGR